MNLLPGFLLGFVAGLRSMTAPAAASRAAHSGVFSVRNTPLAFMASRYTPAVFTALAAGELVADKLPSTPSRKMPPSLIARILSGSLVGATARGKSGSLVSGALAGAVGAIAGTYGGAALRGRMASGFGKDLPAALLEDALAIGLSAAVLKRS